MTDFTDIQIAELDSTTLREIAEELAGNRNKLSDALIVFERNGAMTGAELIRSEIRRMDATIWRLHDGASAAALFEQIERASTPDPDAPACAECGGGLAHFPECSVVTQRRIATDDAQHTHPAFVAEHYARTPIFESDCPACSADDEPQIETIGAGSSFNDPHVTNVDGQHDEMPTRADCPGCAPALAEMER